MTSKVGSTLKEPSLLFYDKCVPRENSFLQLTSIDKGDKNQNSRVAPPEGAPFLLKEQSDQFLQSTTTGFNT